MEVTENFFLGAANVTAEILYTDLMIRVSPNAQNKMEADLLHELVHAILDHLGYKDHDEKRVDELANALYMVIQDNPDMFRPAETTKEDEPNA